MSVKVDIIDTDFGKVKLPFPVSWSFLEKHPRIQRMFLNIITTYASLRYTYFSKKGE